MHAMRYRVVVEDWGWNIPGISPGCDRDPFDTEETAYVIAEASDGYVAASARLNPPPPYDERALPGLARIADGKAGSHETGFRHNSESGREGRV